MSHAYSSARPSRRPVARVGPDKAVFKVVSSAKNVCSVHRFGKTFVYKAIQMCIIRILLHMAHSHSCMRV
ncbi:hypothetical protein FIBSPDRAFT_854118 [Athelia psychrophila]|uniref:Uncharacterized protein n=1 Tax=Athelia psychrophila TaxID=1759441 RepID=A0A166QJX5_9AGAM|nr:hypothetical protein FIBSPDRAFT_854118 [Fibularhizoctonia sp. CBS 109695]